MIQANQSQYNPDSKSHDPIWHVWRAIVKRCYKTKYQSYANYGGRGIRMCPEWRDSYEAFRDWAVNRSGYEPHLTIERVDVNGHYCPENCTWIPLSEQGRNKTNNRRYEYEGESKLVKEWFDDPRCKAATWATIYSRLRKGWSFDKALTTPSGPNGVKKSRSS